MLEAELVNSSSAFVFRVCYSFPSSTCEVRTQFDHADIMLEVSRREKEAGIVPDPDIDTYMKVNIYNRTALSLIN